MVQVCDMHEHQLLIAFTEGGKLLGAVAERKVIELGAALLQLGKETPGCGRLDAVPSCGLCDPKNGRDG